jgi:hypothetical protein
MALVWIVAHPPMIPFCFNERTIGDSLRGVNIAAF